MSAPKQKILVCGDVNGKFKKLFSRVDTINKKSGPFDLLLCVGSFFDSDSTASAEWQPYRTGEADVPVPTYVLGPNDQFQDKNYSDIYGCELGPDITYLGKRGLYVTSSGLRIAYLSGIESNSGKPFHFNSNDVSAIRDACFKGQSQFRGIDILMTSEWPKNIATNVNGGSELISWLAVQVKPRYHFSGLHKTYFERPPYRNHLSEGDNADLSTRFIALTAVGEKEKWIYALSIAPISKMTLSELSQRTTDETVCPYPNTNTLPGQAPAKNTNMNQFFYDTSSSQGQGDGGPRKKQRLTEEERQQKIANQAPCWFCLSSPKVEKHMVISVGEEVYLALAKGGLTADHVLILPIGHHQAASQLPDSVLDEIKKFKSSLKKFFKKRYNKVVVFFERNYRTSHLQIQVVAIPSVLSDVVKPSFLECAEEYKIDLADIPPHTDLSQIAPSGIPYFHVELPDKQQLFTRQMRNFPINFGREALAGTSLLDLPEKVDWRECQQSQEEETSLALKFREEFKPYDFTAK